MLHNYPKRKVTNTLLSPVAPYNLTSHAVANFENLSQVIALQTPSTCILILSWLTPTLRIKSKLFVTTHISL